MLGPPVAGVLGTVVARVGTALDGLLDRVGLTPARVELPAAVVRELREVFGSVFDPGEVVVRDGHVPGVPHTRAFALPGLVYLAGAPATVVAARGGVRPSPTLVHELVHVWQARTRGNRYIVDSLVDQVRRGRRAYDWAANLADTTGGAAAWRALPVEAQAQFVSDAWARDLAGGPVTLVAADPAVARTLAAAREELRGGDEDGVSRGRDRAGGDPSP